MPSPSPAEQIQLPFVIELKRPRKSRVELEFHGQTAIQIDDGSNGGRFRPFLNRHVVEPFAAGEMKAAAMQADLDGSMVSQAAKGTKVELEGTEKVEGNNNHRLNLTLKNGQTQRVWVVDRKHSWREDRRHAVPLGPQVPTRWGSTIVTTGL